MFSFPSRMCIVLQKKSLNEGVRGMATLKAISVRLKSVKNIQKITRSMKMVSASKFTKAERDLKIAKPLGIGTKTFYTKAEVGMDESSLPELSVRKILYIAVTSDRGLSGAVHSSVAKLIRTKLTGTPENVKIVCIGEKSRALLQRLYRNYFLFVCSEVGRIPPNFKDASRIINEIYNSGFEFDVLCIVYNRFRSVVSNVTEEIYLYNLRTVLNSEKLKLYDNVDEETTLSFVEFTMGTLLYYAMKESSCSEQASRMTAMDNASKNAGDMIDKLTLSFNRTRQAVITRELIEIISGASAL